MGIPEGDILNQSKFLNMDNVGYVDVEQTIKTPNVSDVSKAMSKSRPVQIRIMVAIKIKGGTDGPGDMH